MNEENGIDNVTRGPLTIFMLCDNVTVTVTPCQATFTCQVSLSPLSKSLFAPGMAFLKLLVVQVPGVQFLSSTRSFLHSLAVPNHLLPFPIPSVIPLGTWHMQILVPEVV